MSIFSPCWAWGLKVLPTGMWTKVRCYLWAKSLKSGCTFFTLSLPFHLLQGLRGGWSHNIRQSWIPEGLCGAYLWPPLSLECDAPSPRWSPALKEPAYSHSHSYWLSTRTVRDKHWPCFLLETPIFLVSILLLLKHPHQKWSKLQASYVRITSSHALYALVSWIRFGDSPVSSFELSFQMSDLNIYISLNT